MTETRHRRGNLAAGAWCYILLLFVCAAPASAMAGPIAVRCEISSPSLASLYGPAVRDIATHLCDALVKWLRQDQVYSLWSYSTTTTQAPVAALTITVLAASNSEDTLIDLKCERKNATPEHWHDTWLHTGDEQPAARDAEPRLEKEFELRLADGWRKGLEGCLKWIPVAHAKWLQKSTAAEPDLRIISSLRFDQYQRLGSSRFRVLCPTERSLPIILISRARPSPGRYKEEGTNHSYDALVVVAQEREDDSTDHRTTPVRKVLGQVLGLKPVWLMFDSFESSVMEGYSQ